MTKRQKQQIVNKILTQGPITHPYSIRTKSSASTCLSLLQPSLCTKSLTLPLNSDWATIWVITKPKRFHNCSHILPAVKCEARRKVTAIFHSVKLGRTFNTGKGWWPLDANPTFANHSSHSGTHTHTHAHMCALTLTPGAISAKISVTRHVSKLPCQSIWRVWYKQDILTVSLEVLGVGSKIRARDEFYIDHHSYRSPPLTWQHPKLIHSPKRMLHFSPLALDISRPKPIQNNPPSLKEKKKKEGMLKNESGEKHWQSFLQVLQMQRITICLWNVSYFQSVFNSFPNMTHCSSQARGSDVEALRREVLLWSPARKWHPSGLSRKEKNFHTPRVLTQANTSGIKLLVASYRIITTVCVSLRGALRWLLT